MSRLKLLSTRLGLLLLLYTVSRALFLAFNFQTFDQAPVQHIFTAFLVGLRFDIAALCRINGPFIFLSVVPFAFVEKSGYQRLLKIVFLVSNIPFLILNVVDYEYFKFTGERSSLSLLDMANDIPAQIGQLSFHYWYLVAVGGLLIFLCWRLLPNGAPQGPATAERRTYGAWARDVLILVVVAGLAILGARGGWQRRHLSAELAQVGDSTALSLLALNSSFTLIHSQRKCDTSSGSKVQFFATDDELRKQLPRPNLSALPRSGHLDNVVIIIVESLSAEFTGIGNPGHGYTPFLDGLATRGVFFRNAFANGRRSIDAPPSILAGLPHLRDETFYCIRSKQLYGLGSLLKERGYRTSFFHGGKNGSMYFDTLSQRMGFDRYYGLNEYPNPADSDGIWGIYDEPMLQFAARELTGYTEPFASVVFTLSTHNPYKIPAQYEGMFPKGKHPIHQSVAYVDHALKKFFETAEKMPWYKNTLFVITGDHTAYGRMEHARLIDGYRVPLLFFHPGSRMPKVDPNKITQHVDIEPSLLDFLGIASNRILPFGRSIFDPSFDGLAFGQLNGTYWIADKKHYLEYRIHGATRLFDLARLDLPLTDQPEVEERLTRKLQAYIQWFNNGLADNKLYR